MPLTSASSYPRPGSNLPATCRRSACRRSRPAGIVSRRPFRKNAASSGGPSNAARRSGVRYSALVPNEKGLDRALASKVEEIAVFASASESYSRKNLNREREEVIAAYEPLIRRAKDGGVRVRAYLSMIFGDPWDG